MSDEFFIGWLPIPKGYARFLSVITPLVLLLVAGVAVALPLWQQSPGSGVWETDTVVTVEGVIQAEPYALLRTAFGPAKQVIRTLLLVEEGKFGVRNRALALDGQYVRATGTFLHRDGRWMLELSSRQDALVRAQPSSRVDLQRLASPHPQVLGPVTLQGEIIDPKCYFGAMRPGGGKTHKACAILCISGGIPPMLVTRDSAGQETFYLLTATDGSSAKDLVLNYVGDLVELHGNLEAWDDLHILRLLPAAIRRL
jgi:hypothetical protein